MFDAFLTPAALAKAEGVLSDVLGRYWSPAPGETFYDVITDPVAVPSVAVAGTVLVSLEVPQPCFLSGWATSGTALTVGYRVQVNGATVLQIDSQATASLWTLYPLGIECRRGPARLRVVGYSLTGAAVNGVFARIAGYTTARHHARGRSERNA